jgi:hypothetical protein
MEFSIDVPLPSFDNATAKELKKLLTSFQDASDGGPIRGGIISEGDAAAYALVWEFGNARQTKQGPRTTRGVNPDGTEVWLSIQAPSGYIRIHETEYIMILQDQLEIMDFGNLETGKDIRKAIEDASSKAASRITQIVQDSVPVDSADLKDSIGPANPKDPDLALETPEIELGGSKFAHKGLLRALKLAKKQFKNIK